MRASWIFVAFSIFGAIACAHDSPKSEEAEAASANISSPCPKVDGIGYRLNLVGNELVARNIAIAIIEGVGLTNQPGKYELVIEEEANHWAAYQTLTSSQEARRRGDLSKVVFGGGGISMRISKCDGAISQVYFQR